MKNHKSLIRLIILIIALVVNIGLFDNMFTNINAKSTVQNLVALFNLIAIIIFNYLIINNFFKNEKNN